MENQISGDIQKGVPYPDAHLKFIDEIRAKLRAMEPGDSFIACKGWPLTKRARGVVAYEHRTRDLENPRIYRTAKTPEGLRIWRVF